MKMNLPIYSQRCIWGDETRAKVKTYSGESDIDKDAFSRKLEQLCNKSQIGINYERGIECRHPIIHFRIYPKIRKFLRKRLCIRRTKRL